MRPDYEVARVLIVVVVVAGILWRPTPKGLKFPTVCTSDYDKNRDARPLLSAASIALERAVGRLGHILLLSRITATCY